MLARLRVTRQSAPWALAVLLAVSVGVPLVISGPGNDLDVGNVFRSGRAIARHLSYQPSRAPGSPVHETIVGVLDLIGGPLLTNLASVAAAIALLVGLDRLVRDEGLGPAGRWAVALVAVNPWFVIAATSSADYVFALAFVVLAAVALRTNRAVLAGFLAAASMGSRVGSAVLVVAVLAAELGQDDSSARRRVVTTGLTAAAVTTALFVPSFLQAGGLEFAQNDFSTSTPLVHLGRAAVKDLTLLGTVTTAVAVLAVPAVVAALRTWRTSWLVRFAAVGLVLSQLLFVRFPWKVPHLLPSLVCGAMLLAVALRRKPRALVALVVLQLVFAVVRVDVVEPDDPNRASSGRTGLTIGWGPVVTDWRCRRQDPDAYLGRQRVEIEAAWNCARPFGTGPR